MSEYFEIAYAAVSKRLCLFTGTGFSKALSENAAPSWQDLLETLCDGTDNPVAIRENLFPKKEPNPLSLEEAAQVISIELARVGKDIHFETCEIISNLKVSGKIEPTKRFLTEHQYTVITTNYDKLVEEVAGTADCKSLTPGRPIPRSESRVNIYHVHGSIDAPSNMVLTTDDYFNFIRKESYFSRKLSTVLHENVVVIIGYSLGDSNLKAIINDYRGFSRENFVGASIFLLSREKISTYVKDYYSHCYGIRVIDNTEVNEFFDSLNQSIQRIGNKNETSLESVQNVVYKQHFFTDPYLKSENSFFEICSSLAALGLSMNDPKIVSVMGRIIDKKVELTGETGAWSQYTHLAAWLVHLACTVEIKDSSIEQKFLDATLHSMTTMTESLLLGYSWQAYKIWDGKWTGITSTNRTLIKDYVSSKTTDSDAKSIISKI